MSGGEQPPPGDRHSGPSGHVAAQPLLARLLLALVQLGVHLLPAEAPLREVARAGSESRRGDPRRGRVIGEVVPSIELRLGRLFDQDTEKTP